VAITLFKVIQVTDFGTNRKPISDFLLVINTNLGLPPILHRFQFMADYQIFASNGGGVASLYFNAHAGSDALRISP